MYIYFKVILNNILLFCLVAQRRFSSSFYSRNVVKSRSLVSKEDLCSIFSKLS